MGFAREAASSTHFSYEMVALSHATARALGYADAEPTASRSSRCPAARVSGVKADDLLDRLIDDRAPAKSRRAIRNCTPAECERTAEVDRGRRRCATSS